MLGVPEKVKRLAKEGHIIFSDHFYFEQEISVADVENILINGYYYEKEKDETKQTKYKYIVHGDTMSGFPAIVVGKIVRFEAENVFVITAFLRRK